VSCAKVNLAYSSRAWLKADFVAASVHHAHSAFAYLLSGFHIDLVFVPVARDGSMIVTPQSS
jgi:hypothetical protein